MQRRNRQITRDGVLYSSIIEGEFKNTGEFAGWDAAAPTAGTWRQDEWEQQRGRMLTWGLVLGVAAGVHQNVGLKGGVKVVICTEEGGRK